MDYNVTNPGPRENELWDDKTVYRLSGGFNIANFLAFSGYGRIPKGLPLNVNHTTRVATPVKGAILNAALLVADTTAQVKKGHYFAAGDFIGNATKAVTLTNINTDNPAYDVFTFSEAIGAVSNGGTLLSATATGAAKILPITGLNYADVVWKPGLQACTVIIRAFEVKNKFLPYPLTTTQITELTSRFYVIV